MSDAEGPRPVTLLFTDIEGSTRLLGRLGDADYAVVLDTHERLLRAVFAAHGGEEIANQGDGFFVAFAGPSGAVPAALGAILAAIECQGALRAQSWPHDGEVRVRMGIHTGIPNRVGDTYV